MTIDPLAGFGKILWARRNLTRLYVWDKPGLSGLFGWSGLSGSSGEFRPTKHTRQTE